jgi:hypothetical protein
MRLLIRWWKKHADPVMTREVHEKVIEVHGLLEDLRTHIGNGFLDDVHTKLDAMEGTFRAVVAEEVVPLLGATALAEESEET